MAGNYLMNVADQAGIPGFGPPGTTPYGAAATGELPADMAQLKSVIDQLFPAQDTAALTAERERINPNAKGMGLGLGAVLLLSLLGGKAGRAGMGEAMGNFSQGFQGGDQMRMKKELDKWGAKMKGATTGNELRQELFKAAMPKLLDKRFKTGDAYSPGTLEKDVRFLKEVESGPMAPLAENVMRNRALGALPAIIQPGSGTYFNPSAIYTYPQKPKQLDPVTAQKLLQEAGGDKDKARALATQRGYVY